MTPEQKEDIYKLRLQGMGYKAIAGELLLTVDVIKGYCKRHQLNGSVEEVQLRIKVTSGLCLHCKKSIRQKKCGRTKKFCCDACRYTWWNENQDKRVPKNAAIYNYNCKHCGKICSSYGNKLRKFCNHDCYIKSRFGGEEDGIQEISD